MYNSKDGLRRRTLPSSLCPQLSCRPSWTQAPLSIPSGGLERWLDRKVSHRLSKEEPTSSFPQGVQRAVRSPASYIF